MAAVARKAGLADTLISPNPRKIALGNFTGAV